MLGAVVVNLGKTLFTGWFPEVWLFALGALFVAVTLFMPQGILGLMTKLTRKRTPPAVTVEAGQ